MSKEKINIITLGCSKNTVDSEKLIKQLEIGGFKVTFKKEESKADYVIINTCGFINDAKEESINTILKFIRAREKGNIKRLYVTGCLSERYAKDLEREIPEVDKYFGVNSMSDILAELNVELNQKYSDNRTLTGPKHYAYLKISEGCDRSCSFCAIPKIRGKYISEPIEKLVNEAEQLANNGVKELILIAQDLSYYGIDLYGKQTLPSLVGKLSGLNRFEWIRLHYLYPANFPMELVDIINNTPSICKYIDIPIQHITDNMLSSMKRSHNRDETERLLYKLREDIKGVAIRTTLISGYPGETDKDHRDLVDFVKEFKFNRLGVFPYSHEENTWAYMKYEDNIPNEVKEERVAEIMAVQEQISTKLNEKAVGSVMKVLIDRREGDFFVGRTEYDSPEVDQELLVPVKYDIKIGDFYNIKITHSSEFDLFGAPVS